jgi:hypothetical protein
LIQPRQRPLQGNLHHVIGIMRIARQITCEAAQPRQQGDNLLMDVL